MTAAHQAPLSTGFSRQEYWRGLPFPPPGALPDPGIEPRSPHCRQILYCFSHPGSPSGLQLSTTIYNMLNSKSRRRKGMPLIDRKRKKVDITPPTPGKVGKEKEKH